MSARRVILTTALLAALLPAIALAYGYWHQRTHGVVYLSVRDAADRASVHVLLDTDVVLLDSAGGELARVSAVPPHGAFSISHPQMYACHPLEGEAFFSTDARRNWRRCFERQSRWVVGWARDVKYADVRSGSCVLRRVPVTVYAYSGDWALWWVPMPHGGGKPPYSSFHVDLAFNSATCAANAAHRSRQPPLVSAGFFHHSDERVDVSRDNQDQHAIDELLAADAAIMKAIGTKDRSALAHLLADGFLLRVPGAADTDKAAFLNAIAAIPGEIESIRGEDVKAAVFSGTGIVTGVQVAVVKLASDGTVVTNRGAFTDVFERSGGTWRLAMAFSVELGTEKVE